MIKAIEIPLYTGKIIPIIFDDLEKAIKDCGFKYDNEAEHFRTLFVCTEDKRYYLFIPMDATNGEVAAFARKVTRCIFTNEKINISFEQVEHECRLIKWIVDKIDPVLNDKKIRTIYSEN